MARDPFEGFELVWLDPRELIESADYDWQRKITPARRKKLDRYASDEHFCSRAYGVVSIAVYPDGSRKTVDANGRVYIAIKRELKRVPCLLFPADQVEAAKAFVTMNANQSVASPKQVFKALLFSKDPEAITVQKALKDLGITVSADENASNKWPNVVYHKGYSVASRLGTLSETFSVLKESGLVHKPDWNSSDFIKGVALFIHVHTQCGPARVTKTRTERVIKRLVKVLAADRFVIGTAMADARSRARNGRERPIEVAHVLTEDHWNFNMPENKELPDVRSYSAAQFKAAKKVLYGDDVD